MTHIQPMLRPALCLLHAENQSVPRCQQMSRSVFTPTVTTVAITNVFSILLFAFFVCTYIFISLFILIDGWLKKCYYGLGRCRKSCKEEEKKREKCGKTLSCCLLSKNAKLSHFSPKPITGEALYLFEISECRRLIIYIYILRIIVQMHIFIYKFLESL